MAYREPFNVTGKAPVATQPHSPWHSPVPYLFGGLAAMLSLIAFSLLILACSYWKFCGYLEGNSERDLEAGEGGKGREREGKSTPVYEEKILVIMAGQQKPTFIATPTTSSRSSSFKGSTGTCSCTCEKNERAVEMAELDVQWSGNHGQVTQVQVDNGKREETETSESNQTQ